MRKSIAAIGLGTALVLTLVPTEGFAYGSACWGNRWCPETRTPITDFNRLCEPATSASSKKSCGTQRALDYPASCRRDSSGPRWCPAGKGTFSMSNCELATSANSKKNCK